MKKKLEIHSENILPIIKKWLYSDRDIFARELVSNSCDALYKLKILRDQGAVEFSDDDLRIDIDIDKEGKTLIFSDTGIGMTEGEVEKYIAQIAFSGAEEFMEKYKSTEEQEQIIGHFGLGFYSSYMVAKEVEVDTLSYEEGAAAAHWRCDGSSEYELGSGSRETRGTTITLHVDDDNGEYLEEATLRQALSQYCTFLPYPIYLNGTRINHREPLWIKNPSDCSEEEYRDFYRHLYPMEEEPLFWMHLNVDYPFNLKGILYFPKVRRDFDPNKSYVSLYCNRVFVSDNCKDVIPNYLAILHGVIDSPDIPLNVSRSYLQMDRTVRQLSSHISKKVSDSLAALWRSDRDRFYNCWDDVSLIVKLGILEDEKFYERTKEFLIWKNLDGEWTTIEEYAERSGKEVVYYTHGGSEQSHITELYRNQDLEVLTAPNPIDIHLLHYLEGKNSAIKFQRVDANADSLVDKEREKGILGPDGKSEAGKLADLVRQKLSNSAVDVEAKSLASDTIPGIVLIDEGQRRMRDFMRAYDPTGNASQGIAKSTFVVNTNNALVNSLEKLNSSDPDLTEALIHHIYDIALLSQKEMDADALHTFINRHTHVLEQLTAKAVKEKE